MKRYLKNFGCTGSILAVGLIAIAYGQNDSTGLSDDERLMRLERLVTTLDSQLQQRTSVVGPDDRITRDFNLDTRLNNIELQTEQLARQIVDLQRQVANAERIANQAQRDAQMAQQIARNAESRIR
jgi:hypothetical protein